MRKGAWLVLLTLLFLPLISADSIDSEIAKLTNYAEDYEADNIDYAQLIVYTSSIRQNLNLLLGAFSHEEGGMFKQGQIEKAFGEPKRMTRWVWINGRGSENEEEEGHEKKLEKAVPEWDSIVFDGRKIQIRLGAYPSILKDDGEEILVYGLHFNIHFKKPKKDLDIKSKIEDIKELAEEFGSNPSGKNAEKLARMSVSVEKGFESFMEQSPNQCENTMIDLLGEENKRGSQKILLQEIDFYSGDNYDVMARLEMCDDCEWNWINLDFLVEGRNPGFRHFEEEKEGFEEFNRDGKKRSSDEFKSQITKLVEELKKYLEDGNLREAFKLKRKFWRINEEWNRQSNDVWEEVNSLFEKEKKFDSEEEERKFYENFGWIKEEQKRRTLVKEIQSKNYNDRKDFYLNLFSDYEKKEFYFEQIEFEKRLVEEFKEFGEEICNNNKDDNDNEQIDCAENQCGGKVCGQQEVEITKGNVTEKVMKDMHCIEKTCQLKKEKKPIEPICGNNICEGDEANTCATDCSTCKTYPPIENCSGKVVFRGTDENNCPLEPICVEEVELCKEDKDCFQPLCGVAKCIRMEPGDEEGFCRIDELSECREAECVDGAEKTKSCSSGETLVSKICVDGLWKEIEEVECEGGEEVGEEEAEEIVEKDTEKGIEEGEEEPGHGNVCVVKEDCGGEDDVCSNGKCVRIPRAEEEEETDEEIEEEIEEIEEKESEGESGEREGGGEEESHEEGSEKDNEGGTSVVEDLVNKIFLPIITGFSVGDGKTDTTSKTNTGNREGTKSGTKEGENKPGNESKEGEDPGENLEEERKRREEEIRRNEEEREDRERKRENKERCANECDRMCYEKEIMPCTESCIWEECGDSLDCNVDEVKKECESICKKEGDIIVECKDECSNKCLRGDEGFWKDFKREEEEHKEEKGVFAVMGSCRDDSEEDFGRGHLHFGGWGDPFERVEKIKRKYYERGGGDDWCKDELVNIVKQRREFEKSMNEEFVRWFFEKYLVSSAEDWEKHISGIYELYWRDVDLSREMVFRTECLRKKELPEFNLIEKIEYETEFGKIEFWEELTEARLPGMKEKTLIITPFMRLWVFPSKEFMKKMMQKSMEKGEFPGPPEEKMQRDQKEGLTDEEREKIKEDRSFMRTLERIVGKYDGNLDAVIQFKDFENDEIVFNLYAQINMEDILRMEPMPYSEVLEGDVRIEIDFNEIYDMIHTTEKEMEGERIESPPWAERKIEPIKKIKEFSNEVKMYFKVRSIMNSAEVFPKKASSDAKRLFKLFFEMMKEGDNDKRRGGEYEDEDEEKRKGKREKGEEIFGGRDMVTGKAIG